MIPVLDYLIGQSNPKTQAPVAQLDRATDF